MEPTASGKHAHARKQHQSQTFGQDGAAQQSHPPAQTPTAVAAVADDPSQCPREEVHHSERSRDESGRGQRKMEIIGEKYSAAMLSMVSSIPKHEP